LRRKPRSFVAAAYPSREDAERALATLEQLEREKVLHLDDAAILVRSGSGVELHQRHGLTVGGGLVGGGVAGVVGGMLLGVPIVGAIAGLAVGAAAGMLDTGIDDGGMKRLGQELRPGQAALCALIGKADWLAVRERMAPSGGELLSVELTPEAEAALGRAGGQAGAR
jgi:uncharacterized membrane protein